MRCAAWRLVSLCWILFILANISAQSSFEFYNFTACDGALWSSRLCEGGHNVLAEILKSDLHQQCTTENTDDGVNICSTQLLEKQEARPPNPIVLLVDSTFGDVHGLCACNHRRRSVGSYCTTQVHNTIIKDLRPFDWVVFGLVSRSDFSLRHSRCPFIGNEQNISVSAVIFTDRELQYTIHDDEFKGPRDGTGWSGRRVILKKDVVTVAWILEPPVINAGTYEFVAVERGRFDLVFSHDRRLQTLDAGRFRYAPLGTSLIPPAQRGLWSKSRLVSILASARHSAPGHQLRHQIINTLASWASPDNIVSHSSGSTSTDFWDCGIVNLLIGIYADLVSTSGEGLDCFGQACSDGKILGNKADSLVDYMFSFAIENSRYETYVTEKLVDCLVTATVPIYWGPRDMLPGLDTDGILFIDDLEHALTVVGTLSAGLYESMRPAVEFNYNLAKAGGGRGLLDPLGWVWDQGLGELVRQRASAQIEGPHVGPDQLLDLPGLAGVSAPEPGHLPSVGPLTLETIESQLHHDVNTDLLAGTGLSDLARVAVTGNADDKLYSALQDSVDETVGQEYPIGSQLFLNSSNPADSELEANRVKVPMLVVVGVVLELYDNKFSEQHLQSDLVFSLQSIGDQEYDGPLHVLAAVVSGESSGGSTLEWLSAGWMAKISGNLSRSQIVFSRVNLPSEEASQGGPSELLWILLNPTIQNDLVFGSPSGVVWITAGDGWRDVNTLGVLADGIGSGCLAFAVGRMGWPVPKFDSKWRPSEVEESLRLFRNGFRDDYGRRILEGTAPAPIIAADRAFWSETMATVSWTPGLGSWDFPAYSVPLAEGAGARLCFLTAPRHVLLYSSFRKHRAFDPLVGPARAALGNSLFMQTARIRNPSKTRRLDACDSDNGLGEWTFVAGGCASRQIWIQHPSNESMQQGPSVNIEVVVGGFWIPEEVETVAFHAQGDAVVQMVSGTHFITMPLILAPGRHVVEVWAINGKGTEVAMTRTAVHFKVG